ncbi:hypothetical protein ONZ45_g4127 [Pleurotus djamor]|nr:hypothetical protein ONZ45_g4127 [Pleurotus djamor]
MLSHIVGPLKVNATLRDIERIGSLELFINQEVGIAQEAVLAYLSDGRRLTNGNIRELAGSQDQTIYVFNKHYLDLDIESVLRELHVEPPLEPPIEGASRYSYLLPLELTSRSDRIAATPPFRPSELAQSYSQSAHIHVQHVESIMTSLTYQHEAIRVASNSLDNHLLNILDAFESVSLGARKELEKQAALVAGVDADLEIIGRVQVHSDFLSENMRGAIQSGGKPRTLGDYVMYTKMKQVSGSCARTHEEMRNKFNETEQAVGSLQEGAANVRTYVGSVQVLQEAEDSVRRTQGILSQIADAVRQLEAPAANTDVVLQNLKQLDNALRNEVAFMADSKNAYTEHCISLLQQIGALNNDLIQIPPALTLLQTGFRSKPSFAHIQRLHNMLYAYGATVIEIVRRKEFSRFFNQRAQSILEVMAKLSASEKKRRQVYRGDVHGQLPFVVGGMDTPVPTVDFTSALNADVTYTLEREDISGVFKILDDLEQFSRASNDAIALGSIKECRLGLEKLVNKMDNLETAFDRIAERSLLSASRFRHLPDGGVSMLPLVPLAMHVNAIAPSP